MSTAPLSATKYLQLAFPLRYVVGIILLVALYFATACFGLALYSVNTFAAIIWPPTGIALAALFLYGYRFAPGITLGAFLINLYLGASPLISFGIALGNTLEAVVGVYLLREIVKLNPLFYRLRDSIGFIVFAALFATLVSATAGVGSLWIGGVLDDRAFAATWAAWWVGNILGALTVGPFLLRWLCRPKLAKTTSEWIEGFSLFGVLVIVLTLIFWGPYEEIGGLSILYLLFIPLTWASLRTGPRGITLAIAITAVFSIIATTTETGPFYRLLTNETSLNFQVTIGFATVLYLIFTSLVEERKEAIKNLQEHVGKLESALQQISSADRAKNEFLAILGHELRNPLAAILTSTEIIKLHGFKETEGPRLIETTYTHTKNMTRLLDDLLDISKISRKKFTIKKEVVSVQEIAGRSLEGMYRLMKTRGHSFTVTMPPYPILVEADPLRLEQILINLLTNAAKYTPPGGYVFLTVSTQKNKAVITVKDSGIGIDPTLQQQIFEPFFQAHRNREGTSGIGIGLSLTKEFVELHGGTIMIESLGKDQGTSFIIQLPLAQNLTQEPETFSKPNVVQPSRPRKILVVDDNIEATKGLEKLLRYKGHEVKIAHTGQDAIVCNKTFLPEVVLLDIGLPDIDGYEVAKQVQQNSPSPLLIALTGYGQQEDKEKSRTAGFHYHLTKPISIEDIEEILRNHPSSKL